MLASPGKNMEAQKVRFALIGAGAIAKAYVDAFKQHPDAELVSIADVRLNIAEELAAAIPGCRAFDRVPAMLEGPDFDAAIVATPPSTHEEICTKLLEFGKHVLCEKPFTIACSSAKRMAAAATASNRVLTMASKFRYTEDVIKAKELLSSGLIGDLVLFENSFTSRVDMSRRWNSNPQISGGGVLMDNGAHSLDIARYFLGPIHEMQAIEGRRLQPLPVEDTVHLFLRAGAGQMGSIDLSWSLHKDRDSFLDLFGERGTIKVGWKGSYYKTTGANDWVKFGEGYNKIQSFRSNIENFAQHIRDGVSLRITIEDAVANVAAINASYKSLRKQVWAPTEHELTALSS
jgi:predicted dehydrogenase